MACFFIISNFPFFILKRVNSSKNLRIVVIGASAGGLNAVSEVIAQFDETLNIAVFIVLHLARTVVADVLLYRLSKVTSFKCIIPVEDEVIKANHIYFAPPDRHMLIKEKKII